MHNQYWYAYYLKVSPVTGLENKTAEMSEVVDAPGSAFLMSNVRLVI